MKNVHFGKENKVNLINVIGRTMKTVGRKRRQNLVDLSPPAELIKLARSSNEKPKTLHCDNTKDALR